MAEIDYSVIIRTLGTAGEKYHKLLQSIDQLEPQPEEVIVVLPEGYDLPDEQLGYERFCFSKKGMIAQRMHGLNECKTEFALFCDDDVEFGKDFVRYLYEPIKQGKAEISVGPLLSFLVPKGIKTVASIFSAGSYPTVFHKDKYVTMLRSGAWSYNRNIDCQNNVLYPTDSAAWTCFFGSMEAMKRIRFLDENWIEKYNYAALDDQVMFYKAKLRGIRTVVVSKAYYIHNDAKTSQSGIRKDAAFAGTYNRVVFWHRFIYKMQKNILTRTLTRLAWMYRCISDNVYTHLRFLWGKVDKERMVIHKQAYKAAWEYIRSTEYKELPEVLE